MPTTSPVVIVDEQAASKKTNFFTFVDASDHVEWQPSSEVHPFYNHTFTTDSDTDFNSQSAIDLKFSGTGATIMGMTLCDFSDPCNFTVSLDNGEKKTVDAIDFDPNRIILDMQGLSEGDHNLHIDTSHVGLLTIVDYALITPGPNTDISKESLFVNYTDGAVQYTGNWLDRGSGTDSTRGTVTRGDEVEFTFAGSNLTALTVFNQTAGGNITIAVTMDGQTPRQITASSTLTDDAITLGGYDDRVELYHPLFNFPLDNDAGNHTINIQLLSLSEFQVFDLRGFTYVPSFQFLNSATSIVPEKVTTSGSGNSGPNSTGSGGTDSGNDGSSSGSKKLSTGVIVGAVIGSVLGLALLVTAGIMVFRRRQRGERRLRRTSILSSQESSLGPYFPGMQTPPFAPASSSMHMQSSPLSLSTSSSGNVIPYAKTYTPINYEPFSSNQLSDSSNVSPFTKTCSPIVRETHSPNQSSESNGPNPRALPEPPQHTEPPTQQAVPGGPGNMTQGQILEMIERLNNRVEELHHPPAYSTNIS